MQIALALAILAGLWIALRRQASGGIGAHPSIAICWAMLPLDIGPIVLGWLLILSLTHRPLMAAAVTAASGTGLLLVDVVKRATLLEPLVFADRAELLEVVRHPRLYLPFAGAGPIIGVGGTSLITVGTLIWLEPASAGPRAITMVLLAAAAVLLPGWPPVLSVLARLYRAAGITGDPAFDMRRLGFLACLIVHATLARAERTRRRAITRPLLSGPTVGRAPTEGPVVMIQIESFFDARRLSPAMPDDILPGFARLTREALETGHLDVPCWGANTVRTEFAALTGIDQATLGLDRFNPYERFAQQKLPSIAWQMKQAGYRTICLHPFDQGFYARDRVMPLLGFDEFRGPAAFAGAPMAGPYVADEAIAQAIHHILQTEGPRVFVFAITMGNHGPWEPTGAPPHPPISYWPSALAARPGTDPLRPYLAGLQASDRMLESLAAGFPRDGLLAVYGDHQPSLPGAFEALGFTDQRTDYVLWRPPSNAIEPPNHRDIRAESLPALLLQTLAQTCRVPAPISASAQAVRARPIDAMAPDLP